MSHRQAAALVEKVTRGRKLPPEVLEHIVTRTDGVPLYAEELTKTLLDSGALELDGDIFRLTRPLPSLSIPESLHDSLMARLDRLSDVKDVAHLAATLGRVFSYDLLAAVSPLDQATLNHALEQLVDAELIYRRGTPPDAIYEFKHALVQDAAYNSLLRSKRLQIHRRIGETLEERFPETVAAKPELLAHHFREAGLPAKAFAYAMRAGEAAAARYAPTEARARFQEALDLAHSLPPSENASRAQIEAILKLASVAQNRGHYEDDLKNLEQARALAESLNDRESLCRIQYWIGRINYIFGRFEQAVEFAGKALLIAEGLGGADEYTADPVNLLGRIHCLRGEPREAITLHRAQRAADAPARQPHRGSGHVGRAGVRLWHARRVRPSLRGREPRHRARPPDRAPADPGGLRVLLTAWSGAGTAISTSRCREFDEALALCDKSGDVFRKYLAHGWRGQGHLMARPAARPPRPTSNAASTLGDQIGTTFHRGAFQAFRAKLHLLNGEVGDALRDSAEALEVASETAQAWSRSIALRIHAETLLALEPPRIEQADEEIRTAIAIQERRECLFDLAYARLALGHVRAAKGDREQALEAYTLAGRMFETMGVRPGQKRVRAALAALDAG